MSYPFAHSLTLLKALITEPPPLVPAAALQSAAGTYERFRAHPPVHAAEIEDALITFGRVLWPYRKAFDALVREQRTGEGGASFSARLTGSLRGSYEQFLRSGGSFNDLHDVARLPAAFTADDRGQLCAALLAVRAAAAAHVTDAIAQDDREYRARIRTFQALQQEIEEHLQGLRRLAERAVDHPDVASEILETVRMCERGFAQLAREPEVREVCAAIEAYRERHAYVREQRAAEGRPRIFR